MLDAGAQERAWFVEKVLERESPNLAHVQVFRRLKRNWIKSGTRPIEGRAMGHVNYNGRNFFVELIFVVTLVVTLVV